MHRACKLAFALFIILTGACSHATIVATNAAYGVFDGSSGTRTLSVGTHGIVEDLDLLGSFAKCDDPAIGPNGRACIGSGNSFDREIAFTLTGPDGTSVRIVDFFTYTGQVPGAGRVTIRFDDQAERVVGGSVTAGTFRPIGSLTDFNEQDMFGVYTLAMADASSEDPLEFFSASLDVTWRDVPEPGTVVLLGMGWLAMGIGRRSGTQRRR